MKKRYINNIMTWGSIVYLIFFLIVFIKSKILNEEFDVFGADGLTIIGGFVSIFELLASNRNKISKVINNILFFNKSVNYKIMISFETKDLEIKNFVELLENKIALYIGENELSRKPVSNMQKLRWQMYYDTIGCNITCSQQVNLHEENEKKIFDLAISGHSKYGNITCRKKDILYFASLIKIIANEYLTDTCIINTSEVARIEIIIKRAGSQIISSNIFNDALKHIEDFSVKILDGLSNDEELYLSNQEVKWVTLNRKTILDGFQNITDILCAIE